MFLIRPAVNQSASLQDNDAPLLDKNVLQAVRDYFSVTA
jgi:hypothetical protein